MMPFLQVILHGLYGTFYCLSVLDQTKSYAALERFLQSCQLGNKTYFLRR